jgi:hypothetical protein
MGASAVSSRLFRGGTIQFNSRPFPIRAPRLRPLSNVPKNVPFEGMIGMETHGSSNFPMPCRRKSLNGTNL